MRIKDYAKTHIQRGHSMYVKYTSTKSRFRHDVEMTLDWVLKDIENHEAVLAIKENYHRYHVVEANIPIGDDWRRGKRIKCYHVMVVSVKTTKDYNAVITAYPINEGKCVFFYVCVYGCLVTNGVY